MALVTLSGINQLKAVPFKLASGGMGYMIGILCMIAKRSLGSYTGYLSDDAIKASASGINAVVNKLAAYTAAKHKANNQRDFILDLSSDDRLKIVPNTAPNRLKIYTMNLLSLNTRNQRIFTLAKQDWANYQESDSLESFLTSLENHTLVASPNFGNNDEIIAEIFGRMIPNTSQYTYESALDRPVRSIEGREYSISYKLFNHPLTDLGLIPSAPISNSALSLPLPLANIVNHTIEAVFQGSLSLQNRYGVVVITQPTTY